MAMNLEARETLSNLILAITKTGDLYLDPEQVKVIYFLRHALSNETVPYGPC